MALAPAPAIPFERVGEGKVVDQAAEDDELPVGRVEGHGVVAARGGDQCVPPLLTGQIGQRGGRDDEKRDGTDVHGLWLRVWRSRPGAMA